ncbi:MAG: hypothetical protein QNK03_11910, partial [Myxococcota bacterium]|nr:hypothetical protein [Myxococcota bacterium]
MGADTTTSGIGAWEERLGQPLAGALREAPAPERAALLAERVLAAAPAEAVCEAARANPGALARLLHALCGVAPFFAGKLTNHPDWLLELIADDLREPLERAALGAELDAALSAEPDDPSGALRRFKYRRLARITARDCDPELVPVGRTGETLLELSLLADLLLDRALRVALEQVEARLGPPRWRDASGA